METNNIRISCDITQLSGWSSVAPGNHNLTIKAKADGYTTSDPSQAVTIQKKVPLKLCSIGASNKFLMHNGKPIIR